MAEPFVGEVRMFSFNFAPRNWAFCNGASIPINQNQTLFSLLGTQFGGDGRTTFNLPDLRGRVPCHIDDSLKQGTSQGIETQTLQQSEMPTHTHRFSASTQAATASSVKVDETTVFAEADVPFYTTPNNVVSLSPQSGSHTGGGMPHENRQPSLAVNFSIALTGLYPSRN